MLFGHGVVPSGQVRFELAIFGFFERDRLQISPVKLSKFKLIN